MTRISSYIIDQNIVGNDKWIGSDAQNNLRTKNFTPNNLADYFNGNNVIDIGTSIRYRYQTLDIGEDREQGTISFETEIGPQVNFSDITTFLIAKNTLKGNTVTEYLDFLVDGKVILSKSSNINTFGYYKVTSIEPWIVDPNFFVVVVEFLDGNGFIYEDLDYLVSLVDKVSESGGSVWGSITGDIEDQTDLIDYLNDGFYPLLTNPSGYLTLATLPPIPTLTSELINDVPFLVQEEVEEYADLASFPLTGAVGVIYIALDTGLFYTWNGVGYIGSVPPASFTTLQQSYNASPSGQILLSLTNGAIDLRPAHPSINFLFVGRNLGGTQTSSIFPDGTISGMTMDASIHQGGTGVVFQENFGIVKLTANRTGDITTNRWDVSSKMDYALDYSAYYTNRSLIDKGYADLTYLTSASLTGYVPYTGATADVNLGEFGLITGNIEFDNTPTNIPTAAGSMYWNDSDGTTNLILKGGNVTLQVGQEQVIRVVNKTATNVDLLESNYQAVRVTGAQGQRLKVDLAQATNDLLSAETIGLVTETINNNQEGFITTSGLVRNINTTGSLQGESWADGDILYLSPTTPGMATKVKPVAPDHLVILGYVVHAHITQGSIFVKVDNGYELDELHNVKIDTPLNNQSLVYNSSLEVWENKTITIDATPTDGSSNAVSSNGVFDALALKQDINRSETFIYSKANGNFGSHTGTTAETVLLSVDISAGEFVVGDIINYIAFIEKPLINGTATIRVRAGVDGTTSDSLIATSSTGANTDVSNYIERTRHQFLSGNILKVLRNNTASSTDRTSTSRLDSVSLNFSSAWKLTFTIQLSNALDGATLTGYRIGKIKTI